MKTKDFYDYENLKAFNPDNQKYTVNFYKIPRPEYRPKVILTVDLSLSFFIEIDLGRYDLPEVYFKNAKVGYFYWLAVKGGTRIHFKHGNNIYLRQGFGLGWNDFYTNIYPTKGNSLTVFVCTPRDKNSVYLDCLFTIEKFGGV